MNNSEQISNFPQNIDQRIELGKKIYAELEASNDLEKKHQGEYIAIDLDSKKFFIGNTRDEAVESGKLILPNVIFFVKRIGGIDTVARRCPFQTAQKLMHARLL